MAVLMQSSSAHQHPHAEPSENASTSGANGSKLEDDYPGIDTAMLKEIAKRSLIDALNSVR